MLDENYRVTHYMVGELIEKGWCMMRFNNKKVFLHLLPKRASIRVCLLLIVLCILFMNNNNIYVIAE